MKRSENGLARDLPCRNLRVCCVKEEAGTRDISPGISVKGDIEIGPRIHADTSETVSAGREELKRKSLDTRHKTESIPPFNGVGRLENWGREQRKRRDSQITLSVTE